MLLRILIRVLRIIKVVQCFMNLLGQLMRQHITDKQISIVTRRFSDGRLHRLGVRSLSDNRKWAEVVPGKRGRFHRRLFQLSEESWLMVDIWSDAGDNLHRSAVQLRAPWLDRLDRASSGTGVLKTFGISHRSTVQQSGTQLKWSGMVTCRVDGSTMILLIWRLDRLHWGTSGTGGFQSDISHRRTVQLSGTHLIWSGMVTSKVDGSTTILFIWWLDQLHRGTSGSGGLQSGISHLITVQLSSTHRIWSGMVTSGVDGSTTITILLICWPLPSWGQNGRLLSCGWKFPGPGSRLNSISAHLWFPLGVPFVPIFPCKSDWHLLDTYQHTDKNLIKNWNDLKQVCPFSGNVRWPRRVLPSGKSRWVRAARPVKLRKKD